jgi:hypothetical protein
MIIQSKKRETTTEKTFCKSGHANDGESKKIVLADSNLNSGTKKEKRAQSVVYQLVVMQ